MAYFEGRILLLHKMLHLYGHVYITGGIGLRTKQVGTDICNPITHNEGLYKGAIHI